jgi:hypothetical protein
MGRINALSAKVKGNKRNSAVRPASDWLTCVIGSNC